MDTNDHTILSEDYCSFEVSKLLKEKGFDGVVHAYYNIYDKVNLDFNISGKAPHLYIPCSTHQMAMKWLREKKNIVILIEPHQYDYVNEKNNSYSCSLWIGDSYYEYIKSKDYLSYAEAVEAALKYSLENLI